jgi:uncharacterized protein YuzE
VVPSGRRLESSVSSRRRTAGKIVLDLDAKGKLIGIDVLGARKSLPDEHLDEAERL